MVSLTDQNATTDLDQSQVVLADGYTGILCTTTGVGPKTGQDVYVINGLTVTNLPTTLDTNYGTVGASTLRTASQIGNATGAADFNIGATGAQTLRVTNNNNDGYGNQISSTIVSGKNGLDVNVVNPTSSTISNFPTTVDTNYGTVGANTLRTASQIGNATGAADFNAGTTGAQTLRVAANTYDGYGTAIASSLGALSVGLITPAGVPYNRNYGTVDNNTLRVASQIGNATGAANFGGGATGAQTLRVEANLNDGAGTDLTSQANNAATRQGLDTWSIKGTPQHFNSTVGTSAATITPTTTTVAILVYNPGSNAAGVTLSVSFDAGTTFFEIERRGSLSIETEVASFQIKASAAASAYQILVTRR